jgi:hypothetical protein
MQDTQFARPWRINQTKESNPNWLLISESAELLHNAYPGRSPVKSFSNSMEV